MEKTTEGLGGIGFKVRLLDIMRGLFYAMRFVLKVIVILIFACGVVMASLGVYEFYHVFSHLSRDDFNVSGMGVGLLRAIDLFLLSIVFFVFSLGLVILFNDKTEHPLPLKLPDWLRVKNFMELKVILWEAVLTTLVVSYLAGLVEAKLSGHAISITSLVIPGGVLIISVSLYFLKKGEH